MKINFESKPFYGVHDKYIKTKIKMNAGSIITHFHDTKMSKEDTLQMFIDNNDRFSY